MGGFMASLSDADHSRTLTLGSERKSHVQQLPLRGGAAPPAENRRQRWREFHRLRKSNRVIRMAHAKGEDQMIDRRIFIGALTATLVGAHGQALPQKTEKLPRVGVLVSASPSHPFADAFRRGLQPLGYVEGENIVIEWRYTEGRSDRAAALAADRCHRRPFHTGGQSRHGSHPDDPDRHGAGWRTRAKRLYRQLGPPGGNVTGLSGMDAELGGKRLQLLREVIQNRPCR